MISHSHLAFPLCLGPQGTIFSPILTVIKPSENPSEGHRARMRVIEKIEGVSICLEIPDMSRYASIWNRDTSRQIEIKRGSIETIEGHRAVCCTTLHRSHCPHPIAPWPRCLYLLPPPLTGPIDPLHLPVNYCAKITVRNERRQISADLPVVHVESA